MPAPNFVVTLRLADWLILTGKGQYANFSKTIPANSQITQKLDVPPAFQLCIITGLQFDGVLSGQIAFQVVGTGGSMIGGFAVQAFMQEEFLVNDPGQPFLLTTNSSQAQQAVVNIDYVGISQETWRREILPFIAGMLNTGH